jgi:hypothetical protein
MKTEPLASIGDGLLRARTLPLYPLEASNLRVPPKIATVREIDFQPIGNFLEIYFSRASFDVNIPQGKTINDVISGWNNSSWTHHPYKSGNWKYGTNQKQKVPVTPMSLRCDDLRYVVYILSHKSWEFSEPDTDFVVPFSVGASGKSYFLSDGASGKKKAAYIIANGKDAASGKESYCHGINIHVDLIYDNGARVPLVIDPDIRHPGGSGEP